MPEGAIWPAQKAAPATTSIVTALSVEAEVSAVLMRCLRLPAAHFWYSGVAFSLWQMALSSCKPSRNDRWDFRCERTAIEQPWTAFRLISEIATHYPNINVGTYLPSSASVAALRRCRKASSLMYCSLLGLMGQKGTSSGSF